MKVLVEGVYSLKRFNIKKPTEDSLSALGLVFKKGTNMCMQSGIRFFNDPYGINEIRSI